MKVLVFFWSLISWYKYVKSYEKQRHLYHLVHVHHDYIKLTLRISKCKNKWQFIFNGNQYTNIFLQNKHIENLAQKVGKSVFDRLFLGCNAATCVDQFSLFLLKWCRSYKIFYKLDNFTILEEIKSIYNCIVTTKKQLSNLNVLSYCAKVRWGFIYIASRFKVF